MIRFALLALALAVHAPLSAHAQESRADRARVIFERAVEDLRRGQFPRARDQLREALELFPTAGTAFNLALALNGTGETVEAVRVLDQLGEGAFGPLTDAERTQVAELLTRARADLVRLTVVVAGPPRARVRVDGEPAGEASPRAPLAVTTDAGRHVVDATAPEHRRSEIVVEVTRGEARRVELRLAPVPPPAAARIEDDDSTLWESPWTWVVLGVLVAGGAVATWWVLDSAPEPVRDPVFGVAEVLR